MKRVVSLILVSIMLLIQIPTFAASVKPELPEWYKSPYAEVGNRTPFQPIHQYKCMQNPPNFTWTPACKGTNYDLIDGYDVIVCSDEELTDIKYSKYGIKWHYYSFPNPFEPGLYYWAVRYYEKGNKTPSDWSAPRRFRILEDAYEFVIPEDYQKVIDDIPVSHPRIYMTKENRDEFLKRGETEAGKAVVEKLVAQADAYLLQDFTPLPDVDLSALPVGEKTIMMGKITGVASANGKMAESLAFAYQFTGEEKYAKKAKEVLLEMAEWDINGLTSFESQDQAFFEIMLRGAFAYDWCYDYLTEEERAPIRKMLAERIDVVDEKMLSAIRNDPYDSHMWAYTSYYVYAIIAVMHEADGMDDILAEFLEMYMPTFVPQSTEDGGWAKGTAYWSYGFQRSVQLPLWFALSSNIDFFEKAWAKNAYLFPLYMYPAGSWGNFGDESNRVKPGESHILGLATFAVFTDNPVAAWLKNQIGKVSKSSIGINSILYAEADVMEEKVPIDYPRAHTFLDQGMTAMHSDLLDPNRIALYFRADKHGSYNHLHPDQNAFMIEAFGDRLAIKSGYYDGYHSAHDSGFTRKTYAHNTITFDGGEGQRDDDMNSRGNTDMFVTSPDFDAVVGDATRAYDGNIGKFVRSIIYVRPDTYIVVDDLKSAKEKGSSFEWWLNAENSIYLHEDKKGASIKSVNAHLDARVQYPEKVTGYYIHKFSDPWGRDEINPDPNGNYASSPVQERIWFETEKVKETKMITTMNVHKSDEAGAYVKSSEGENYVKLEFENGTIAFVSTSTDVDAVIEAENFKFNGTAVVFNDKSIMLVGGKSLEIDGKVIFTADRETTFVAGKDRLSISSNDDYSVKIATGNRFIEKVESITSYERKEISEGYGIVCEKAENELIFKAEKGHYSMLINNSALAGEPTGEKLSFDIIINGEKKTYEGEAFLDPDGNSSVRVPVDFDTNKYYLVDKSENFDIEGVNLSYTKNFGLGENETVVCTGNGNYAEFKSFKSIQCEIEQTEDFEGLKKASSVIVEAEDFDSISGSGKLTAGVDHFVGITRLNDSDSLAEYTLEIPEDGYYDFVVRCAAWQEPFPIRYVEIGDTDYIFTLPNTGGYGALPEHVDGIRVKTNIHLPKGTLKIYLGSMNPDSLWNYDWLGFIKTE